MKIVLEAVLEKIATIQDGSVKISLASQEIDPQQASSLFTLRNKFCKVLISDNNISPLEENLVDAQEMQGGKKTKSQAQRLRAVMFKVHEKLNIPQDFDKWYMTEMEQKINAYKDFLNED
jgi:hypothetical protein